MKLYNYFRSGTSHRLRIALNLKGVVSEYVPVDLRNEGHLTEGFRAVNPQQLVPALEIDGQVLIQSPSIIEWLEERYPDPPFLPSGAKDRACVRALAAVIGCDIHPINNRRVLEYLRKHFSADEEAINSWCGTWIASGFDAYEAILANDKERKGYSFGSSVSVADVYLIPQIESARRFKVNVEKWPRIMEVDAYCGQLDAFIRAKPIAQPDAV